MEPPTRPSSGGTPAGEPDAPAGAVEAVDLGAAGGGSILVTVTGPDGPGIAGRLFDGLAPLGLPVLDVEQVHVHGQL
ncbi:MAG: ACT domain-containing protein, partial [Acidimicrobiales bacterium]